MSLSVVWCQAASRGEVSELFHQKQLLVAAENDADVSEEGESRQLKPKQAKKG